MVFVEGNLKEVTALHMQSVMSRMLAEENGAGPSKPNADPMQSLEINVIQIMIAILNISAPLRIAKLDLLILKNAY